MKCFGMDLLLWLEFCFMSIIILGDRYCSFCKIFCMMLELNFDFEYEDLFLGRCIIEGLFFDFMLVLLLFDSDILCGNCCWILVLDVFIWFFRVLVFILGVVLYIFWECFSFWFDLILLVVLIVLFLFI